MSKAVLVPDPKTSGQSLLIVEVEDVDFAPLPPAVPPTYRRAARKPKTRVGGGRS